MEPRSASRPAPPSMFALAAAAALVALAPSAPLWAQVPPGFSMGLVTDVGGIDDRSFNEMAWRGLERFAADNGLNPSSGARYLDSSSESDYLPNLSAFGKAGASLVVAPGFLFYDILPVAAARYPRSTFLIIDSVALDRNDAVPSNVACAVFKEHEGAFLVGVAAGLKAKEAGADVVGFLGGMQFALIEKFLAGFEQGVRAVHPGALVLVEWAGTFIDPEIGRTLALKMFDEGAYVVFHAAGYTAKGAIMAAKESTLDGDPRWIIGADIDQYADGVYAEGKSVILTSFVKRVDVAAYEVARLTFEGRFPGGEILEFGAREGGVGLPEANPNLGPEQLSTIEEYRARIASGELVVSEEPGESDGGAW